MTQRKSVDGSRRVFGTNTLMARQQDHRCMEVSQHNRPLRLRIPPAALVLATGVAAGFNLTQEA